MSRTLKTAALQLDAHDRAQFSRVWPRMAARIREAAAGAQLIVLPEGTLPGYVLGYERFDPSEIAGALTELRAIAKEHVAVIVAGAARNAGARTYNSAIVIDSDGEIAGAADKYFLWHFDRQWYESGERIEPVRTSIGRIGALICADGRIPLIASTLVDRGAEILVMPTAWVTSGRDPENLENIQADLLARVRARENGVPFAAANKCGVEMRCVAYCGKSQILARDGTALATAPERGEHTLIADVELDGAQPLRDVRGHERKTAVCEQAQPARIAIAARAMRPGDIQLLQLVQADALIAQNGGTGRRLSYADADDALIFDPAGLAALRLQGTGLAVWRTSYDPQWQIAFARARALELRMYLIVIDASRQRAFAVDPDGAIVCGTYPSYELAAFLYEPARCVMTLVAPGTDVRAGLERAHRYARE